MPSSNFSKKAQSYEAGAQIQKKCASELISSSLKYLNASNPLIADLGCGTGSIAEIIFKSSAMPTIENYDISEEMLKVAQKKLNNFNATFYNQSLPVNSDYDMIASNFALQWYDDLPSTIKTCIQKLKPEGILSLCIPIAGSFETLRESFLKADASQSFFKFPDHREILESITNCEYLLEKVDEESLEYNSTLEFFKNIHQIGANQPNKRISKTKLRKLIRYHDELFDGKIIVKYKILKLIVKRVS